MKHSAKLLWQLFTVFFKIGLFTFGGGYAMLSLIDDACVERRSWITREEMEDLVVVAESTPGPVAINCATFVGARQGGLPGALAATLGMVLPSFLVIFAVSRFLDRFLQIPLVANAFRGVKLAVCLLILDAGLRLLRRLPRKPLPIGIFLVCLGLSLAGSLFSLRLSSVVLLLGAGGLSLLAYALSRRGGRSR
ncbi:MAG: chromate transporter [Oscillospiraceae bacterium]|nr:chromate transporter [Oscillospiraceae bacterium]